MPQVVRKVWPEFKAEAHSYIGKDLTELTVTFAAAFTSTTFAVAAAPYGAIHRIIQQISERAPVVMIDASTLETGTVMRVVVEGQFPMDNYGGTANEDFATYLTRVVRALSSVTPPYVRGTSGTNTASTDVSGATVAVVRTYQAQQV